MRPDGDALRTGLLRAALALGVGFVLLPLAVVVFYSFSSVAYGAFPRPGSPSAGTATSSSSPGSAAFLRSTGSGWRPPAPPWSSASWPRWRWSAGDFRARAPARVPALPDRDAEDRLGVGWFIFFARLGFHGGVGPLVLAHTIVVLPFVINILAANLVGLDPSLEEAARDLGAPAPTVLWRIVLPQIRAGLVVSALLAFLVSFDQVESSIFLTRGENNTLPIEMFLYMEKWQDPTIAALPRPADPVRIRARRRRPALSRGGDLRRMLGLIVGTSKGSISPMTRWVRSSQ